MVLQPSPKKMTEVTDWVFSELKAALPPGLSKLTFKAWLSYLYEDLELVLDMTAPSYEQVITVIGRATILEEMNKVVHFLTILYFLKGIAIAPKGRWTYLDFLDTKDEVASSISEKLQ